MLVIRGLRRRNDCGYGHRDDVIARSPAPSPSRVVPNTKASPRPAKGNTTLIPPNACGSEQTGFCYACLRGAGERDDHSSFLLGVSQRRRTLALARRQAFLRHSTRTYAIAVWGWDAAGACTGSPIRRVLARRC